MKIQGLTDCVLSTYCVPGPWRHWEDPDRFPHPRAAALMAPTRWWGPGLEADKHP